MLCAAFFIPYLPPLLAPPRNGGRRRTGAFPGGDAARMPVCARLRHVAGTQWDNKKYMNMKHLEAAPDDVSIAG